jgi:DNA-binding MarR family transcriptional regulator
MVFQKSLEVLSPEHSPALPVASPVTPAKPKARRQAGAEIDSPERRRLPLLLRRAWFGLNQTFRRRCTKAGITPDQFTALRTLREQEPASLSQRELTEKMASDPNTIASLLKRMEEDGLIARRPDPADRRTLRVSLQPAGRRKFAQVRKLACALQAEVLSALPEQRREQFLEDLETIAAACQEAVRNRSLTP